jgi:PKD repeat protein
VIDGANPPVLFPQTVDVDGALPVAAFEFNPAAPDPGEPVLFASNSFDNDPGDSLTQAWDFGDGSSATGANASHTFATPGTYPVTLTVTDEHGGSDSETVSIVVNDPSGPAASFDISPLVPATGQTVTFTSTSQASLGNSITAETWDLDGDGDFGDETTDPPTASYNVAGQHVVRLMVTQSNGKSAVATRTFRVNAPPVAGFVWSPSAPVAGEQVELLSTSVDNEGPLQSQVWDLDGDGLFGDASGPTATQTFDAGDHVVRLRITDSDGVVRTLAQTISVGAPPPASPVDPVIPSTPTTSEPTIQTQPATDSSPAPKPSPGRLSAVVRLNGIVLNRFTRIKVLAVRAPLGASVTARCSGKGCPRRSQRLTSITGRLRFSAFERRLPAGVQLEVLVQARGMIGKYTRFLIRAGKSPIRTERCLMPGSSEPVRCPL